MNVSEKAVSEIKRIIIEQNLDPTKTALRIRAVGGGCSGITTKLDLDEEWDEAKDEVQIIGDNLKLVVDKRSLLYLSEATVDYHEDLNKRGFVVNVPGTTKCGCGSSFSV
jgi:iron-sulfur cluster assembly protein